jgi:small subunit ribosomal protein S6
VEVFDLKTVSKKLYEAMFLVDSAKAASDWDGVQTLIKNILEGAEGEVVSIKKWDERRLAYEIGEHSRGTYILCYFRGNGRRNTDIERSIQLSEQIIRVLILCADHVNPADIEKDTPATRTERSSLETETDEVMKRPVDQEETSPDTLAKTTTSSDAETPQDSAKVREASEDAVAEQTTATPDEGGPEQSGRQEKSLRQADEAGENDERENN